MWQRLSIFCFCFFISFMYLWLVSINIYIYKCSSGKTTWAMLESLPEMELGTLRKSNPIPDRSDRANIRTPCAQPWACRRRCVVLWLIGRPCALVASSPVLDAGLQQSWRCASRMLQSLRDVVTLGRLDGGREVNHIPCGFVVAEIIEKSLMQTTVKGYNLQGTHPGILFSYFEVPFLLAPSCKGYFSLLF